LDAVGLLWDFAMAAVVTAFGGVRRCGAAMYITI
jgi:hypothetical protein